MVHSTQYTAHGEDGIWFVNEIKGKEKENSRLAS
jgi:hypothetical protein